VQVARLVDGSRCVTHVTEVVGMESDVVSLQDIFVARPAGEGLGSLLRPLEPTGLQPHFLEKLAANGVTLPTSFFLEEPPTRRGLVGAATGPRR
jgi:pilus assembly protein CpaF